MSQAIQHAAPAARVVAGFHLVPASALADLDRPLESDIILCADDDDARRVVLELVTGIPELRAFDGGSLVNAVGLEAFAALILSINIRHKGKASVRLEGVDGYRPDGAS